MISEQTTQRVAGFYHYAKDSGLSEDSALKFTRAKEERFQELFNPRHAVRTIDLALDEAEDILKLLVH